MFLTDIFKKYKHQQSIDNINKERDQAFNDIIFKTALKDAAYFLAIGEPLKAGMLKNLLQRLAIGLPVGTHCIQGYEVTVYTDSNGIKKADIEKT